MTAEILALCRAMGAGADREELLLPLVQAAQRELVAWLRPGVSPRDCGPAFPLAAAMVAMEGLEHSLEGGQALSFTAGDLSIRTAGGADASRSAQARRLLAPWLGETGFAFRGVRG